MEIIKKEKQLREVIVVQYNLCDKCGKEIEVRMYDAFEFSMEHKTGDIYPESGGGKLQTLDLCPECVLGFIQLLKENGYKVQECEWDY